MELLKLALEGLKFALFQTGAAMKILLTFTGELQSSISLFSLPRTDFEPPSEERSSTLASILVEARSKSGLANRTTSLAAVGLDGRSRSRPLATYWTLYFTARNCWSLVSNVAKEIKFSCPSGLIMILLV